MSKLGRIALVASVLACSVGGALADSIKIGINQPLTGSVAASGNFITDGAKLAAAAINKNGGVLGKQLELVIEDNKSNPSEAAAAAAPSANAPAAIPNPIAALRPLRASADGTESAIAPATPNAVASFNLVLVMIHSPDNDGPQPR